MGGQAQVVTFALDALLAQGEDVRAVVVLHMDPGQPRVQRALAQLAREFAGERYGGRPLAFRRLSVTVGGRALREIDTPEAAEGAWAAGRDLLAQMKRQTGRLHVCLAGGPRLLALTLTSAAQLHCEHRDRLWHLYTPKAFMEQARDGALLHAPPEVGVRLIPVPLVPWGAYFPSLRALAQPVALPLGLDPRDAQACAEVWARLTPRQQDVVRALAQGLLPQEAADALCVTLKTLDSHKTQILAECRSAWALDDGTPLTYHFLRSKFGPWLALATAAPC